MDPEQFYAAAKDADILIYNSTVEGEISFAECADGKKPANEGLQGGFERNRLSAPTDRNMFQQVSGTAEMISDFHAVDLPGHGTAPDIFYTGFRERTAILQQEKRRYLLAFGILGVLLWCS